MRKFPMMVAAAGTLLALSACGSTDTTRGATGAGGGALAGAVVGGPVGAVVGGVGGAAAGVALDEGLEKKTVRGVERAEQRLGVGSGSTDQASSRTTRASASPALSRERVRDIQQALNDQGRNLDVDGIWGPNTRNALRQFQRENNLDATGRVDRQTLSALNLDNQPADNRGAGNTGAQNRDNTGRSVDEAPPPR